MGDTRPTSLLRRLATLPAGRRAKWAVLVFWLLVAGVAGPVGGKLTSVVKNDQASYLPSDAESTRVIDLVKTFPSGQTFPAVVLAERSAGVTAADRAALVAIAQQIDATAPHLAANASAPIAAPDGRALLVSVPLHGGLDGDQVKDSVTAMRRATTAAPPGLAVSVGGIAALTADEIDAFKGIDSTLLYATLAIVVVILLVTYRSPVLWVVPLIAAAMSYTLSQALVYELAAHAGLVVSGESQGILTVLVFGAGTDYALLLIARYREELTRHDDRHDAMRTALRRVSPAVLASASTVVLGLLCLFAATLASDRGLAPVGAAGIVCTFAALMTLLPALLAIFGRFLFWPFVPHAGRGHDPLRSAWGRAGVRIAGRARLTWVVSTALLVALALGVLDFHGGLTNDQAFRQAPASVLADRALATHFPAGVSSPVETIGSAAAAAQLVSAAQSTPGIVAARVAEQANGLVRVEATLSAVNDSQAAWDTVDALRARVHAIPGANALVGGESAITLDVENAAVRDRLIVMPLILAVVLAVLVLLLRAVVAPLLLIASVALSFLAALGGASLIFDHLLGFAGADQTLPLLGFVFLVALGVDYNIFLMSRVREETLRLGTRRGVLVGLATTGGVITSAGVVLAATFSALGLLPLVFLTEIGVLVAFGVLLDTLLVRSVLVPALVLDLDARVWWPSRLWRRGTPPQPPVAPAAEPEPLLRD
ncbi:MAG TPA: MMPL family transporter [Candidatus Dormibacteraeota bacterium]|nr:MMPL family transporter [Candidatus Dormibacteraeota bacterium]